MSAAQPRRDVQPLFRTEQGELVVAMPERSMALSMLSQPLEARSHGRPGAAQGQTS